MTLKSYLTLMIITTIICWGAWTYVLFTIDPSITNWIGFTLFYVSLFLAMIGTSAIAGFIIRFIAMKKEIAFRLVKEAFRQSFLFAILITASLMLASENLFSWLNLFLLVVGLTVLEFFLLSYTSTKKSYEG